MMTHSKILIFLLLTQLSSKGQFGFPNKAFHKHIQTCHYVGTTEEDFNIVLYDDSLKVITYTTSYRDQYNSVTRHIYNGTYYISGDTLKVNFANHSTDVKGRKMKSLTLANESGKYFQYPPASYIISDYRIASMSNMYPILDKTATTDIVYLDMKFNNWDRRVGDIKEVFGLSDQ